MDKYLEAMEFSTKVFERLMKAHPERASVWKRSYRDEMSGIVSVAIYDNNITVEEYQELVRMKGEKTDDLI